MDFNAHDDIAVRTAIDDLPPEYETQRVLIYDLLLANQRTGIPQALTDPPSDFEEDVEINDELARSVTDSGRGS